MSTDLDLARHQLTFPDPRRDHIQGRHGARIALLEYGDFECPVCGESYPVVKAIQDEIGADLCFAFRHFPLANIHPHAQRAAEAAEAAGAQGKFWPMHDQLFQEQEALEIEDLTRHAGALGLDVSRFVRELLAGTHRERVREDFRLGARGGVNGTPSFFINGTRYDGLRGLDPLLAALNEARGW